PLTQPSVEPEPSPTPTPLAEELDTPPIEEENRVLPPPPVNPTPIPIPTEQVPLEGGDRTSQSIFIPGDIIADSNPEAEATLPETDSTAQVPIAPGTESIPKPDPFANSAPPVLPPSPPSFSSDADGFTFEDDSVARSSLPSFSQSPSDRSRSGTIAQSENNERRSKLEDEAPELSTAFDVVPQIAELRGYFQSRWEPLPGLTRDLEYTLILNEDGSLQRAIPLGHAADNYLDRTGVPLEGESMVSSFESGQNPQMRVVLEADGGVKTFLESLD
ncbi:hypothetical protein IQ235_15725, partial [Oscillatoriales cyanobacterium LEGE 11467]|nr:hypothetical protein [Zarconia navalis LEGE 11467]